MNGPGVENGLSRLLAAQHDQQIADHCRLSLLVKVHDALV